MRKHVLILALCALPWAAAAQGGGASAGNRQAPALAQNFDDLSPQSRDRVGAAFRSGSPDLDDAAIRQRWDAMTADQRGETLRARERQQTRSREPQGPQRPPAGRGATDPGRGHAPGPGAGPRPGPRGGGGRN
jgi:hypothetical protein